MKQMMVYMYKRCEVPKLANRRKELLASMMYRKSRKIMSVHTAVNTRSADKFNFQLRRPRTEMYKKISIIL